MNKFVGKLLPRSSSKTDSKDLLAAQQDAGFTLLEVIVVVLIVGILAAIVAPGWLGFVNRQRVNKANDTVVAALQEAQRQAKRTKRNYSVSFGINSNIPQIAVYPGTTPSNWQNLGGDLGIKSKQILLGANLSAVNTTTSSSTVSYSLTTPVTITYDYMGILPNADFGGTAGLKIVVAVPNAANPTQASSVKRCVIVNTLLGSMLTAKDSDCS
ncbi:MAG: prepilin-type N-terminal cleavage/methylation domain-containing protein [Aulosira sp. ZfuVER01]|nr:prepilin-type N-terminal cleavage/methylation domain-containing protein [Aulosira sp. ZfuVER01]MDZ7999223.1 prepilin-type N-terminal cleavage/methylation domain-containing protein [Aulosira sp. DedVER01a]MDZ8051996.1 prepilin-type N-terminal cleavage/methylation domain-containing protein [Aulosira sp. ZfuCHP01]